MQEELLARVEVRKGYGEKGERRFREIARLFDSAFDGDFVAYEMFRGALAPAERDLYTAHGLRYDITEIFAGVIGDEFVKTAGHFHPLREADQERWPELYQIIQGKALFILQRDYDEDELEVCAVHLGPGDVMLIPGGFGHVMTNIGGSPLTSANIVSGAFASDYSEYQERCGAAVKCGINDGNLFLRQNSNYQRVINIKELTAMELARETGSEEFVQAVGEIGDIHEAFVRHPEAFAFLR